MNESTFNNLFAQNLKFYLKQANMTQADLAKYMNCLLYTSQLSARGKMDDVVFLNKLYYQFVGNLMLIVHGL